MATRIKKGAQKGVYAAKKQQAELKRLKESSELYRLRFYNVVEKNLDGIIILNRDGIIRYLNPAAVDLFGQRVEVLLGEEFGLPVKGNYTSEFRILNPARGEITVEIRVAETVWRGKDAYLVSLRDITERKNSEKALKQAKDEIEKWNKELEKRVQERTAELKQSQGQLVQAEKMSSAGIIAAGVAHEINNPLAGVLSLLRSYSKEKEPGSEEYNNLKDMVDACEHIATIVKDFSSFARYVKEDFVELNCNEVIESTLSFSAFQLVKKNITIEKYYDSNLPMIKGNKSQLQQVILNMITNARDAIKEKGLFKITTRAVSADKGKFVEMEFTDNGSGIKEEDINNIFDPFFTTKRQAGGVGLGLSVSYKIINGHNGQLTVESGTDKGTTFIVKLPVVT